MEQCIRLFLEVAFTNGDGCCCELGVVALEPMDVTVHDGGVGGMVEMAGTVDVCCVDVAAAEGDAVAPVVTGLRTGTEEEVLGASSSLLSGRVSSAWIARRRAVSS